MYVCICTTAAPLAVLGSSPFSFLGRLALASTAVPRSSLLAFLFLLQLLRQNLLVFRPATANATATTTANATAKTDTNSTGNAGGAATRRGPVSVVQDGAAASAPLPLEGGEPGGDDALQLFRLLDRLGWLGWN